MTKEEEKAIERLKNYKEYILKCGNKKSKHFKAVVTVLNMLKEKGKLYHKALGDLVKADRENIQLKKQIDLMAERLRFDEELKFEVCKDCEPLKEELCGEPTKTQYQPTELKCVKQYFERKRNEL